MRGWEWLCKSWVTALAVIPDSIRKKLDKYSSVVYYYVNLNQVRRKTWVTCRYMV